jgi:hypothetical protein
MQKGNFWQSLKEFMINVYNENNLNIMDYYATMKQHKDFMQFIIDDCSKYYFDFYYNKPEDYTNGSITIYFQHSLLSYFYKIDLLFAERPWGYCQCTPEMEGYNSEHKCCGNGCDWIAPNIKIDKIETLSCFSFDGFEKDMWKLKEEFNNDLKELHKKQKKNKLNLIIGQIEDLEQERKQLLNELGE